HPLLTSTVFVFSSPIPPPPRSPLFPYTTLFRSPFRHHVQHDAHLVGVRRGSQRRELLPPAQGIGQPPRIDDVVAMRRSRSRLKGDRKSTRLNSSHRTISYAVFCLKKKIA